MHELVIAPLDEGCQTAQCGIRCSAVLGIAGRCRLLWRRWQCLWWCVESLWLWFCLFDKYYRGICVSPYSPSSSSIVSSAQTHQQEGGHVWSGMCGWWHVSALYRRPKVWQSLRLCHQLVRRSKFSGGKGSACLARGWQQRSIRLSPRKRRCLIQWLDLIRCIPKSPICVTNAFVVMVRRNKVAVWPLLISIVNCKYNHWQV